MRSTDFKFELKGPESDRYICISRYSELKYHNRYLREKKLYLGIPKGKTWIGMKTRGECRGKVKSRWEERTVEVKGGEEEQQGGFENFGCLPCYCNAAKSPLGPVRCLSS